MRKLLFALSACVLCAAPLRAQETSAAVNEPTPAPAVAAVKPAAEHAQPAAAPSLYPTTDEIRQQVATAERQRNQAKAAMPNDFLYLVAAIVVGVVIAALILD